MNQEELNRQLLEAAEKGDFDRIWELVELGADVNASDENGMTALMGAARSGSLTPELLEALVSRGADVNARDEGGWTVLTYVTRYGHLTPELLETFIQNGADIDSQDVWGRTPLIVLSEKGFLTPELLKVFGSNGADVDIQDDCSDREKGCGTAIMHVHAAGYLSPLLTKMFIDFGTSLDISTTEEWNDDNEDTSFYVNAVFYINAAESLVNAFSWILDTDPQWVVNFFKDKPRLGKSMLEKWTKMNVPGTTRLVAKLVEYAKTGEAHKESCNSFSPVMEF